MLLFHALHEKIYEGGRGLLEQVSLKIFLFNSREGGRKMLLFHALHEKEMEGVGGLLEQIFPKIYFFILGREAGK